MVAGQRLGAGAVNLPGYAAPAFLEVSPAIILRVSEVVAVLDASAIDAPATRECLGYLRRQGLVEDLCLGATIRSAVICARRAFLCPLSAATLRRRLGTMTQ